jgi:hypothetical protein
MDDKAILRLFKKAVAWLLLAVSLMFLLTGFGITSESLVEPLTAGLLTKALSIRVHEVLWAPFLALLVAHLLMRYIKKL